MRSGVEYYALAALERQASCAGLCKLATLQSQYGSQAEKGSDKSVTQLILSWAKGQQ